MIYLELFLGFLQVGCFTFGGGYASIALIREITLAHGWLSEEMLANMIAVSESTPGPIMVNMATYVGSSQGGFWGAVVATLAVVLPSFVIILLITALLKAAVHNSYVQAVLRGLNPCVTGIILATGLVMLTQNCLPSGAADLKAIIITGALILIPVLFKKLRKKSLSPIGLIICAAVLGMILYGI